MKFTASQQFLIDGILKGVVQNIDDHLMVSQYDNLQTFRFPDGQGVGRIFNDSVLTDPSLNGSNYTAINENLFKMAIIDFMVVVKELEPLGVIIKAPRYGNSIFPIYRRALSNNLQDYEQNRSLLLLIKAVNDFEIHPTRTLTEYVANGFRTSEQIFQDITISSLKDERNDRKAANRRAVWFAIATILVSLASIAISFLTFTTDREVKITNANAFKDTTKVLILTISNQDSLTLNR